ncbi:hypothetical protein [Streptomyces cylindrosporus]|uniref:SpdD protein n=1 Tax=Streptomyces cylindrosporus TaxID=2927583 RepID=A0ABS9YG86_9ACTN|nr:hypothetical protein [Streptomyces cylindrosporus]MCI3276248.1 hypothetical protein [Streptomyces cylindrosporus]
MNDSHLPVPSQARQQPYVLTDAFGRTYLSSAPLPAVLPGQAPNALSPSCGCSHAPAAPSRTAGMSPGALIAGGAVAAVVLGAVLVALLLSVAVVAASVAVVAVSLAVCAMVLRSMTRDSARSRRGPRGF